jgi:hypothetical protein
MPTLSDALRAHDASRDSFNNWLRKGSLRTDFATAPGVARQLSRENSLEIGFMAALERASVPFNHRSSLAENWLRKARAGRLPAMVVVDRARPEVPVNILPGETCDGLMSRLAKQIVAGTVEGREPTDLTIVNLAEIVRRVDALHAQEG